MKTVLIAATVATATALPLSAQETVKNLYTGTQAVTWENTLKIEADQFAEGIEPGNYISISLEDATDVLEIKANGTWLPGSRLTNIQDAAEYKAYITDDMLSVLKSDGMEICGASFTVTGVEIKDDGFQMPEGAIWGGYFWVDNWNTLELFKTAFDNYAGQRYLDIYLSGDNDGNTGYFMKVLTKWDDDSAIWADNAAITHLADKAVVDLKDIDVPKALEDVSTLMVQSNPEGGNPYNITAIALRKEESTGTGVEGLIEDAKEKRVTVYSMQGAAVRVNVPLSDALNTLPKGIYIIGGRKVAL